MSLNGKHISLMLLFMAYIMLLGHDVIPHHHHNQSICTNHHCNNHEHPDDSLPLETDHKEEGTDHNCCEIIVLIVRATNDLKQEIYASDAGSLYSGLYIHIFDFFGLTSIYPLSTPVKAFPGTEYLLTCYLDATGLRGPPAIL